MVSERNAAYPPLDVLKPVADGIWIVDSGPLHFMGLALPVRMTVVRLRSGDLWLHSPTRFRPELKAAIEALGPIRHLVAPNAAHWTFLRDWQAQCPEALTWAAPGLRKRPQVRKSGLRVDRDVPQETPAEWASDFELAVVPGAMGFREVTVFHHLSKTLILTDLVVNLEPERLPFATRMFARITGTLAPDGRAPAYLRLIVRGRRKDAAQAMERLLALAPERVIFAHGRWFEHDGATALRRSMRWLLGDAARSASG